MKIGIVGQGYVGTAIKVGFEPHYDLETYDKYDEDKSTCDLTELVETCEVIFVCVPTPMNKDGSCHTDIVESVVKDIDDRVDLANIPKPTVVIKSTVPPGTTDRLHKKYKGVDVIFNPEFLTERNAVHDFNNQNRVILGGPRPATSLLKQVYTKIFPSAHIIKTGSSHAEMIRYFTNCFLATKVSFANEMYSLATSLNLDYDKIVEYSTFDERLGKSHWQVPGHDGDLGFGGHCFPKDLSAIIQLTTKKNTINNVLKAVKETNDKIRKNRDWEKMKGRAIN